MLLPFAFPQIDNTAAELLMLFSISQNFPLKRQQMAPDAASGKHSVLSAVRMQAHKQPAFEKPALTIKGLQSRGRWTTFVQNDWLCAVS